MGGECTKHQVLTSEQIARYKKYLQETEKCEGTITKYMRDVDSLSRWLSGENNRHVSKDAILRWRSYLVAQGLTPRTVNAKLSAVNGLLYCFGWEDCRVRFLKIQRRLFRAKEKDLTRTEYDRLLNTAVGQGKERLGLLMETLYATGIRVSELKFITMEAVQKGQTDILSKGKVRTILLPRKLCIKLKKYAKKQGIESGTIFRTRSGKALSRRQVWAEMKALCRAAKVDAGKVFPHNLRHLFATTFYTACRDIVRLSDALGHSCIETTRIYLISTKEEIARLFDRMQLVQ